MQALAVSSEEEDFVVLVRLGFAVELFDGGLELVPVSALEAKMGLSKLQAENVDEPEWPEE